MTTPDVSIVICTQNRAALLKNALASLYDLATEDEFTYEIVVVDRGSTDETSRVIAEAAAQSRHPLRGVVESRPGMVAARNRGLYEAQGRWITFLGDDQVADWHWLAELYRGALERNCRVVGGGIELALPAGCNRELAPEVRMLLGEPLGEDAPQPFGGDLVPGCGTLLIQRSVLDQYGPFQEALDGRAEESDLFDRIQRAGIEAWYFPTATVHQLTPAERLERDYLLELARTVGRGEALRQRKSLGLIRFTFRWLRRWAQHMMIEYPRLLWAGIRRNAEYSLACHCQWHLTRGYLTGACGSPKRAATPAAAAEARLASVMSTAAPAPATAPAASPPPVADPAAAAGHKPGPAPSPAPAFSLRSAEPTAVMEFPPFSVGPRGSGSH